MQWSEYKPKSWDDIVSEPLRRVATWGVISVNPQIPWPVVAQRVLYLDQEVWILPVTTDCYPGVALYHKNMSYADAGTFLSRFLSALSWLQRGPIASVYVGGGGSHLIPKPLDRPIRHAVGPQFDLSCLPEPNDRASLALALMREGRSIDSAPYGFLTFYRVIEFAIPDGNQRKKWIEDAIPTLRGVLAIWAKRELGIRGVTDIPSHLYKAGRMAIAHAQKQPIIDPDDVSHHQNLLGELPIMEALAERAISERFEMPVPS